MAADENKEAKPAPKTATAKPKAPAKAPVKNLPQMMEEDIIPALKAILEAQEDITDIELSFEDNKVGSHLNILNYVYINHVRPHILLKLRLRITMWCVYGTPNTSIYEIMLALN